MSTSFIETDGAFAEVAAPESRTTTVTGINNSGVVVGYFQPQRLTLDRRGFVFDGTTYTLVLWNPPSGPNYHDVSPSGISDDGLVAGAVVSRDEIGFIALPGGESVPAPKAAGSAPARPNPVVRQRPHPATASHGYAGIATRGYLGTLASVKDGVLTFTAMGPGGKKMSFKVLPVGQSAWIAKDAEGYVMFSMLGPGTVSGTGLADSMGAQIYQSALSKQGSP